MKRSHLLAWVVIFGALQVTAQTTNSWISVGAGNWHSAGNWSAGLPSNNQARVQITNALTKTAIISAATTNFPGTLTISNLFLLGVAGATNAVQLSNPGTNVPLRILNSCTLSSGGRLEISNGAVQVSGSSAFAVYNEGDIVLQDPAARLIVTNGSYIAGVFFPGALTVSSGTVLAKALVLGYDQALGVLNQNDGTVVVLTDFTLGGFGGYPGVVWLTGGKLSVTNGLTTVNRGSLTVSNGTLRAKDLVVEGNLLGAGTLTVAGGTFTADRLVATSSTARVQFPGGTVNLRDSVLANGQLLDVGAVSNSAVLNLVGGTNRFDSGLNIDGGPAATGTVWLTSGLLLVTNKPLRISYGGAGQMTVSNGTCLAVNISMGGEGRDRGTLTLAGGTTTIVSNFSSGSGTQTLWMTAGQLTVTNGAIRVGLTDSGRMTVSNGTWRTLAVLAGRNTNSCGTLTVDGGVGSVYSNLTLGFFRCVSTGILDVTGGALRVTNNTATAVLDVRSGTLTQSGGTLDIDRLVITNFCGRFIHTGGTLITGLITLTPGLDADGDEIWNSWEQAAGLDPFDPNDAALDYDGDGMTNLEEFHTDTDPYDATKFLHVTSIVRTNNNKDVLITWPMETLVGLGLVYRVQWGTNLVTGITNDLSPLIFGGHGGSTNYLDVGGATNRPTRFYRVRGQID